MLATVLGSRRPLATVLRVLAVLAAAALVLAVAYITVRDPSSGPTVTARRTSPPVRGDVGQAHLLGRGRATMASGAAGLWVARQSRQGAAPGRLYHIHTATGVPAHTYKLPILPLGVGVGRRSIWVLGTAPGGTLAVLLRVSARSGAVEHRLPLAAPPACATAPFASCIPVPAADGGVWVPLQRAVVHVPASGAIADRNVMLKGDIWDMTATAHYLWVLAEKGAYHVDQRTGRWRRVPLGGAADNGMQPNHIAASKATVWVSSYPRGQGAPASQITQIPPSLSVQPEDSRMYPGAGALAITGGGLWLSRYDGQGELDRLDAGTGELTGPFLVLPQDDPTVLVARDNALWVLSYRSNGNFRTLTKVTLTPVK